MGAGNWTPERINRLIQLWQAGHTLSSVGKELGVTRNAIAGKISRLGIKRKSAMAVVAPAPGTCPFPVGSPGSPDFHWCCKIPRFGRSLCPDHEVMYYNAKRCGEIIELYKFPQQQKTG